MNAIEILNKCQEQGVILTPKINHRLEIYGRRAAVSDELLEKLKAHKNELIKVLNVLQVFEGRIISDWREATTDNYNPILCPNKGNPWFIHPEVCKWHREMNDPKCEFCEPKKVKQWH